MTSKTFRWSVCIVTLGAVAHYLVAQKQAFSSILGFRLHHIAGIYGLMIGYTVVRSYRMLVITRAIGGLKIRFWEWFQIFVFGRFSNIVLPQSGNVYRAGVLKKSYNLPIFSYISAFAFFAWADMLLNFVLALIIILMTRPTLVIGNINVATGLAVVIIIIFLMPFASKRAMAVWTPKSDLLTKATRILQGMVSCMATQGRDPKLMAKVTGYGLIIFGFGVLSFAILFRGMKKPVEWFDLALFLAFYNLSLYITITPGNIGVRELIFGVLASALGLGMAEGILASSIHRMVVYLFLMPLGLWFGGRHLFGKKKPQIQRLD